MGDVAQCNFPLKINIIGINREQKKAIIFNPRCKKWECPYCAELNRDWWTYQAVRGTLLLQSEGLQLRMITVTSRSYATPVSSTTYFVENWPKLNRRAAYHTNKNDGAKWAYFLVPERTKSGVLHAHLIAATPLTTRWWKDNGYHCGFGYMATSEPLHNGQRAADYVAKYLGKGVIHTGWPPGFRRVRSSKSWPMAKPEKVIGWDWESHGDESVWYEKHILLDAGFHVIDKRLC